MAISSYLVSSKASLRFWASRDPASNTPDSRARRDVSSAERACSAVIRIRVQLFVPM